MLRNDIADPVEWRPRRYNQRADWLCNAALDTKSSYSFQEENLREYTIPGVQWEVHSDGACRGDGFSSFSWIIDAIWPLEGVRHKFTVAMGYEIVHGNFSSFRTELWGVDMGASVLRSLLLETGATS